MTTMTIILNVSLITPVVSLLVYMTFMTVMFQWEYICISTLLVTYVRAYVLDFKKTGKYSKNEYLIFCNFSLRSAAICWSRRLHAVEWPTKRRAIRHGPVWTCCDQQEMTYTAVTRATSWLRLFSSCAVITEIIQLVRIHTRANCCYKNPIRVSACGVFIPDCVCPYSCVWRCV